MKSPVSAKQIRNREHRSKIGLKSRTMRQNYYFIRILSKVTKKTQQYFSSLSSGNPSEIPAFFFWNSQIFSWCSKKSFKKSFKKSGFLCLGLDWGGKILLTPKLLLKFSVTPRASTGVVNFMPGMVELDCFCTSVAKSSRRHICDGAGNTAHAVIRLYCELILACKSGQNTGFLLPLVGWSDVRKTVKGVL